MTTKILIVRTSSLGDLVHMLERHHIEGRPAILIAENLKEAYNDFCN